MQVKRLLRILLVPLAAVACGKKSEPLPPVPPLPARTTDLKVEQQGETAEVTFSFPSQRMDGAPLTDLDAVEIYRIAGPGASLTAPPPSAAKGKSGPSADRAPISGQRRRAQAARMQERSFFESATKVAEIRSDLFPSATRGSQFLYHDSLADILKSERATAELGYAVVTVRRNGLRSEISNVATIKPVRPPAAPEGLLATAEENRICLSWQPPPGPVEVAEYKIYRRRLEEDDYGPALGSEPASATDYADTSAAYGSVYVYTVTAVPKDHPASEGPPAIQFGIRYDDVFPPPAVSRLDALPEQSLVRLHWTAVEAPDLAGYELFRSEDGGPEKRLNDKLLTETSFVDSAVEVGKAYSYRVRSVDKSGNASAPSPAAEARPFRDE